MVQEKRMAFWMILQPGSNKAYLPINGNSFKVSMASNGQIFMKSDGGQQPGSEEEGVETFQPFYYKVRL